MPAEPSLERDRTFRFGLFELLEQEGELRKSGVHMDFGMTRQTSARTTESGQFASARSPERPRASRSKSPRAWDESGD